MVELLISKIEENLKLTSKQKDLIAANIQIEIFKPKEIFIQRGESADKIGFIVKGVFRHIYYNRKQEDTTMHFMKENDFVTNVTSFFENRSSTGTMQSETVSQIIVIDRQAWNLFSKIIPGWTMAMTTFTNDTLIALTNFQKLIIHEDSQISYEYLLKQHPTIAHRVPLSHIASLLGIKQSTLSRLRQKVLNSK